jgi:hypothetical protein
MCPGAFSERIGRRFKSCHPDQSNDQTLHERYKDTRRVPAIVEFIELFYCFVLPALVTERGSPT